MTTTELIQAIKAYALGASQELFDRHDTNILNTQDLIKFLDELQAKLQEKESASILSGDKCTLTILEVEVEQIDLQGPADVNFHYGDFPKKISVPLSWLKHKNVEQ